MDIIDMEKAQGIIDFSKTRKKKNKIAVNDNIDDNNTDIKTKMATAKLHGQKEIDCYKKSVDEFLKVMDDSALFKGMSEQIKILLIDYILETVIEPIFKGHNIANLPNDVFIDIRKDIFKDLIKKYCNN